MFCLLIVLVLDLFCLLIVLILLISVLILFTSVLASDTLGDISVLVVLATFLSYQSQQMSLLSVDDAGFMHSQFWQEKSAQIHQKNSG